MAAFRTCPICGANLDPGERCDCRDDSQEQPRKAADDEKEEKTA